MCSFENSISKNSGFLIYVWYPFFLVSLLNLKRNYCEQSMILNPLYLNSNQEIQKTWDSIIDSFVLSFEPCIVLQPFPPVDLFFCLFLMLDPEHSCSLKSLDQTSLVMRSSVLPVHVQPIDVQLKEVPAIKLLKNSHYSVPTLLKASVPFWDLAGLFMTKSQSSIFDESLFLRSGINLDSKLL